MMRRGRELEGKRCEEEENLRKREKRGKGLTERRQRRKKCGGKLQKKGDRENEKKRKGVKWK